MTSTEINADRVTYSTSGYSSKLEPRVVVRRRAIIVDDLD